jgi:hypothetical protein
MKRIHESKRHVCDSDKRTDLPWIEFLRLLLMVGALLFFGLGLSVLMGESRLIMSSLHALERVRHAALRVPLQSFMLNWNVMTETHPVMSTTRTYPVSSEMCFSKEKSQDIAVLCNPLAWQQTYLCDYNSDLQYAAVRDYLRGMGWAHHDDSVKYFVHDYQIDNDSDLSKHTLKNVCAQQRIFDNVLVHNDAASISVVDTISPTLTLATLLLLCGLVSAFLAANLHVNRTESEEYPMFFMPSWVNSYWGVGIGLFIVVAVIFFVWRPMDTDSHDHHHHAVDSTNARRHGMLNHHHHTHLPHHHHNDNSHDDDDESPAWATWIIVLLLLSIVSAIVFCSPMRRWYGSRLSLEQHYSTANFVKYGISALVIILTVWIVSDILGHSTVGSVPLKLGESTNTIWIRTEQSSSSIVIFVWVLFEALYLLWPYVHVTTDNESGDASTIIYDSVDHHGKTELTEVTDLCVVSEAHVSLLSETPNVASQLSATQVRPTPKAFHAYNGHRPYGNQAFSKLGPMNAAFAPSFAPVIDHSIEHFKTPIHTPSVKDQRCELAFVSVYATFAMLAWPLITLLALSLDSKYEVDVVIQSVLVGGLFLGVLEYVRCTLLAVLDYSSRYVDCCWNAMTTLNCVLQLLIIVIEGFVFMILLDFGLFSSSDGAEQFVTAYFYVTVLFALLELIWYALESYGSRMSSISNMSLWEGLLAVFSVKLLVVLLLVFLPLSVHNEDRLYSPVLDSLKNTCADARADPTTCKVADELRSEFWMNGTVVQNWPLEPWLCSSGVVTENVREQYCKQ